MGGEPYRSPVVELVGPAGSGKTTLSAHVMRIDEAVGPGHLRIPLHRFVLGACRLLPTFAGMRGPEADVVRKDMKRMLYLDAMSSAVECARRSGPYRVLLLDEGPVYMLARMRVLRSNGAEPAACREWVRKVIAWWGRALDMVVLLDAPNAVLVRRIRGRSDPSPTSVWPDDQLSTLLTRYRFAYEQVVRELGAAGPIRIVRIATDGVSPTVLAGRIHAVLSPAASAA
jgi:hypothetical protein